MPLATALSRETGAAIHLVSVLEPISAFAYAEWETEARSWMQDYLNGAVQRVSEAAGGEVTSALLTGHVVDMLEEEAQACGADVVVMAGWPRLSSDAGFRICPRPPCSR